MRSEVRRFMARLMWLALATLPVVTYAAESDVDALVAEAITATGAASAKEMGKVMGWLGPKTKGRVDGKVLSGKVTAALAARG